MTMMTWGKSCDLFQWSFLGGRFKTDKYLGGNVFQFTELVTSIGAKPIGLATVVYNQEGQTWVIEEPSGNTQYFTPLTAKQYAAWKETQRDQ